MSIAITPRDLIKSALRLIGALSTGEDPSAAEQSDAFAALNQLIDAWGTEHLTIPYVERLQFDLVADQSTYTIGPGADFDTARPNWLDGAGLLLSTTTPETEIKLHVLTDDEYAAIPIKDESSTYPQDVYYRPTNPDGTIILWPVPNTGDNPLILYVGKSLAQLEDVTTEVNLAPAYAKALRYALAVDLAPEFGRPLDPLILRTAETTLSFLKTKNFKPSEMTIEIAGTPSGAYNILTDTYT